MTPADGILEVFISHFKRAIRQEMDAMRERKGTFEIFLTNGERMESGETPGGGQYILQIIVERRKTGCRHRVHAANDEG